MKKSIIGIVTCSKEKLSYKTEAYNLYSASKDFKLNINYAIENYDDVYIASGKFGLLDINTILDPYDVWIGMWNKEDQYIWGLDMVKKLIEKGYKDCEFVVHVDDMYFEAINYGFKYYGIDNVTHVHYTTHN